MTSDLTIEEVLNREMTTLDRFYFNGHGVLRAEEKGSQRWRIVLSRDDGNEFEVFDIAARSLGTVRPEGEGPEGLDEAIAALEHGERFRKP